MGRLTDERLRQIVEDDSYPQPDEVRRVMRELVELRAHVSAWAAAAREVVNIHTVESIDDCNTRAWALVEAILSETTESES